jgi:hypothetical protein
VKPKCESSRDEREVCHCNVITVTLSESDRSKTPEPEPNPKVSNNFLPTLHLEVSFEMVDTPVWEQHESLVFLCTPVRTVSLAYYIVCGEDIQIYSVHIGYLVSYHDS